MEQWEREEENIIKREKYIRDNYVPISEEQQKKNMSQNWMEVVDEDGNKHYEPLIDNCMFIDASNLKVSDHDKKGSTDVFRIIASVLVVVFIQIILIYYFAT